MLLVVGLSGCTDTQEDASNDLGYINDTYGYGFNPPEGWTESSSGTDILKTFYAPNESNTVRMSIAPQPGGPAITLSSYVDSMAETIETDINYSLLSRNERTVNDLTFYEIVFSYTEDGDDIQEKYIYTEKGMKRFWIIYKAMANSYVDYASVVDESINSFTIV